MVNKENIDAFINYNYIPFNKRQCIKRLVIVWISSAILCFIGKQFVLWAVCLGTINLLMSVLFIALIVKSSYSKISRYLCDGIFYLYFAIILNFASYRVITLQIGRNWMLSMIFLLLLFACILIFLLVTVLNIKSDRFSGINNAKKMASLPFFGGICGILAAKIFLQGQSQQTTLTIIAFILLLLSFVMSIPSINLLKAVLYKRQNTGDGSVC